MRINVFPRSLSAYLFPSRHDAASLARRLVLLGCVALCAATCATAAVVDVSGVYTNNPTSTIGASNTANLTGDTSFNFWGGNNCPIPVITNGFMFTIDSGGGNAVNFTGNITGTGGLTVNAYSLTSPTHIGGSVGNTYSGATVVNSGRVNLEKSSGNALCGSITVKNTADLLWTANNQLSDASDVTLVNSGSLLDLAGFSDTINELHLVTGSAVQTGAGGVLKVAKLFLNGTQQADVAKIAGDGFVLGSGYIEVGASGPPVILTAPAVPAAPVPADTTSTVNPALLTKLDWADSAAATSYDVYLWLASGSKPVTPTLNVGISEYTLSSAVLSLSNYRWQVVAKNSVGNTAGPEWTFSTIDRRDISGTLTNTLDSIVGAGPARLTANTTTWWGTTTAAASINLNGFELTLNNGGGNAQYYNGAITGPGTLRIQGNGGATWTPDIQLGGTVANSPDGVTLNYGRLQLNKTAGVDALAGAITVNTTQTVRIQLLKSNQINDASTITSTAGAGLFVLEMGGFSDTISGLVIKTGDAVDTGTGGTLTVTNLTVNGVVMSPGTYTSSSSFVLGSGSVIVPGATTPASATQSTLVASPTSLRADGVNPSTLTVTLLDGANAAVAGKTVTLVSSRGSTDTISAASGVSNISGAVTFTVRSTTPGAPVFTATDTTDSVVVSQTAGVSFTSNPAASLSQSTLAAAPTSVMANGVTTSVITVTLKESGGTAVAGKIVTLASSRGATDTISAASGPSNASGVVTFTVTSLTAGAPVFTATDSTDSVTLSQTASVTFTANPGVVDISNALGPLTDGGISIDTVVGAGHTGRLVGITQTYWASGGFSVPLDLNGNTLVIDTGGGNAMSATGAISGDGLVRVNAGGIGILHIGGAVGNTYTGTTEINNGPVKLEKTSGNALCGAITVNGAMSNNFPDTGTLLWGANNQINDGSSLTLSAGSSINLNSFSDTVGTLALTGDASIYLGGTTSMVHFANSSGVPWTAGMQLVIREWNGSPTGGGSEGVFFGTSAGGLSAAQIANVGFMNPAGFATGLYHAAILATGEVVPSGSPVVATAPPYDLSPAAAAARAAFYSATGRADLTAAGSPLTSGTHIVFFGDSITWLNGYITLLNTAIATGAGTQGKTITLINRGINGGTTANIRDGVANGQASFASLLVSDQANIAVVFIGINDIWWAGTTAAAYEQALRDMAASAAAQHVKLIFATPAAHNESPIGADSLDPAIVQFAGIVQTVAASTGATFVNLRAAFVNYWKNNNYEIRLDGSFVTLQTYGLLTYDGVHPTDLGTQLLADQLAEGILASFSTGSAFDTWAGGKGLTGSDAAFGADPDHDGLSNGIEFVLGGDPNPAHAGSNSSALLPTVANVGNSLVFTYTRTHESAYLNPAVEFNTGLQGTWTTATAANATIAVTPGAISDTVTVTIPKGASTQLFARLKVVQP